MPAPARAVRDAARRACLCPIASVHRLIGVLRASLVVHGWNCTDVICQRDRHTSAIRPPGR